MKTPQYQGVKTFVDKETGEEVTLDMIYKPLDSLDRKGWRRVILSDLLTIIDEIGNKKIKVLEFLIDNMNGSNEIDLTQREVAKATGISLQTISSTFKALTEANLIKKHKRKYVLNTRIVSAYGNKKKNQLLCIDYGFHEGVSKKPVKRKTIEDRIKEKEGELQELKKAREEKIKAREDRELLKAIKNDSKNISNNPLYTNSEDLELCNEF